jgi:hypothetical protein
MQIKWHDMTLTEYKQSHVTTVTAGSTWISTPWYVFFVAPGTPVEIRRELEKGETVRVEVLAFGTSPRPEHQGTVLP